MKVVADSGDTCGIPSFETDSFNVSNAGPGATRANNGTKFARKPGQYTATWDGTDTRGRRVANGIYFYGLDTPDYRNVKKAVMMR